MRSLFMNALKQHILFFSILLTSFITGITQAAPTYSASQKAQLATALIKGPLALVHHSLQKKKGPLAKSISLLSHTTRIANSALDAITCHSSRQDNFVSLQKHNAFWACHDSYKLFNELFAINEPETQELTNLLNNIDTSWEKHLQSACSILLPLAESTLAVLIAHHNTDPTQTDFFLMKLHALEGAIRSLEAFLHAPDHSISMYAFGALAALSFFDAAFTPFIKKIVNEEQEENRKISKKQQDQDKKNDNTEVDRAPDAAEDASDTSTVEVIEDHSDSATEIDEVHDLPHAHELDDTEQPAAELIVPAAEIDLTSPPSLDFAMPQPEIPSAAAPQPAIETTLTATQIPAVESTTMVKSINEVHDVPRADALGEPEQPVEECAALTAGIDISSSASLGLAMPQLATPPAAAPQPAGEIALAMTQTPIEESAIISKAIQPFSYPTQPFFDHPYEYNLSTHYGYDCQAGTRYQACYQVHIKETGEIRNLLNLDYEILDEETDAKKFDEMVKQAAMSARQKFEEEQNQ